jgi:hypothetical protein
MAASVALLTTACAKPAPPPSTVDQNRPAGGGATALTAGALLISDGSDTVTIAGQAVKFPSTVTDAAWSPDGSRIAYIDGDGNVATARPDGTDVLVLTTTDTAVVRSRPSWSRDWVYYAEKKNDGTSTLMSVSLNGCDRNGAPGGGQPWGMDTGNGTSYVDLSPSSAFTRKPQRLAFQHNEPSGPQIWINDTNQRNPYTHKVTQGSDPAISADGQRLAYVGPNGQIYLKGLTTESDVSVQITFGADHPTRLTWNPDGQHIAYETPSDIEQVGASPGANANPATTLSPKPGVPAFLTAARNTLADITGADPVALSIAASQARWPSESTFRYDPMGFVGSAGSATLATPDQALSASLVASNGGPLLFTSGTSLDPRTKAELQRIFGRPGVYGFPTIDIVDNGVSSSVVQQFKAMGYDIFPMKSRPVPDTPAGECGSQLNADLEGQTLVVVNPGSSIENADATSMAYMSGAPILRLTGGVLTDTQKAYLAHTAPSLESVYVVGAGVSPDVQKQIGDLVSGPAGYVTANNPLYTAP